MGFMKSMVELAEQTGQSLNAELRPAPRGVFEVIFSGDYSPNHLQDEIIARLYVGNAPAESELRYLVPDHLSVGALLLDEEFTTRLRARLIDEYLTRSCR